MSLTVHKLLSGLPEAMGSVAAIVAATAVFLPIAVPAAGYEVRLNDRPTADARVAGEAGGAALDGVVVDGGRTWTFIVSDQVGRAVEFREGGRVVARLTDAADDDAPAVRFGAIPPAADARSAVPDLPTATAIRAAAIRLAEIAPSEADRPLRLTVLELYSEVAKLHPELQSSGVDGKPLPLPDAADADADGITCASYTQDALFDCRDEQGNEAVVPFLDEVKIEAVLNPAAFDAAASDHEEAGCYGACGPSCGGKCVTVPVACDSQPPPTFGALCYRPHAAIDTPYRPRDDFDTSPARCPSGASRRGDVTVCTSAPCCLAHDECNRHDRGVGSYLKCQMWGLRKCGFRAVFGVPKEPSRLKWFHAPNRGTPINLDSPAVLAGTCNSADWSPPAAVPHAQEQVNCPVHGIKHTE